MPESGCTGLPFGEYVYADPGPESRRLLTPGRRRSTAPFQIRTANFQGRQSLLRISSYLNSRDPLQCSGDTAVKELLGGAAIVHALLDRFYFDDAGAAFKNLFPAFGLF